MGQMKLGKSKVLVVGAGGLGCPVLTYLAATGIGQLGIVDFDTVCLSNLNRQTLYTPEDVDKPKALVAQERIQALNPEITVVAHNQQLNLSLAMNLFPSYDVIVDGTDNFASRAIISQVAYALGIPVVYAAIYKHEGQITVFNYQNGPTYSCLFPSEPAEAQMPNCASAGVLGTFTGIIGTLQAQETVKVLLELDHVLSGKVLYFHGLTLESTLIQYPTNPNKPSAAHALAQIQHELLSYGNKA